MRIDVWSDVVCPFCYLGKRRLESALTEFPHRDEVEVVWHSFELDPDATTSAEPLVELLSRKYGMSVVDAQANQDRLTEQAAAEGLEFHLDQAQHGNTFDAHRLIHLAADRGVQDAAKERLLRGYFTDSVAISDHDTLIRLAVEVGLAETEVRKVLASDDYADAVRADEAQARAYGISGVPFFVLDGKYSISGAQPKAVFTEAIAQAWTESHPTVGLTKVGAAGQTCDDGSCAS
jgi:predicted DsbA family dithiol-disulfide isomerase